MGQSKVPCVIFIGLQSQVVSALLLVMNFVM